MYEQLTIVGNLGRDPELRYTDVYKRQVLLLTVSVPRL